MRTKGQRAQDTKIECVRNILDLQYLAIGKSLALVLGSLVVMVTAQSRAACTHIQGCWALAVMFSDRPSPEAHTQHCVDDGPDAKAAVQV